MREGSPKSPFVLVCTKVDLRNDQKAVSEMTKRGEAFLSEEQGKTLQEAIGARAYLECSAKSRDGVDAVFETAVRVVVEEVEKLAAPHKSSSSSSSGSKEGEKPKRHHRFRRWLNK